MLHHQSHVDTTLFAAISARTICSDSSSCTATSRVARAPLMKKMIGCTKESGYPSLRQLPPGHCRTRPMASHRSRPTTTPPTHPSRGIHLQRRISGPTRNNRPLAPPRTSIGTPPKISNYSTNCRGRRKHRSTCRASAACNSDRPCPAPTPPSARLSNPEKRSNTGCRSWVAPPL